MARASTVKGRVRAAKTAVVADVRDRLSASSATLLTEYRGLTVADLARLRAELRKAGAEYLVVKNTLARRAAKDAGLEVPAEVLTGPTAVAFCGDDPVAAAKALRTFSRERPALVVKGGILDGRFLGAEDTLKLADLQSREELLAQLAGMFQSAVAQPARLALAALSKAARLFAALAEKKEAAGPDAAADASAAGEGAPDAAGTPPEPDATAAAGQDEAGTAAPAPAGEPTAAEQPLSGEAADAADAPATEPEPGTP